MEFYYRFVIFLVLCIGSTKARTTTAAPAEELLPCPCVGQPEGIVIPHPSDCRAYYTCLGGSHVLHSRCGEQDKFFHPYMRSCVQRSTFVSFVPDFIPTKDVCKITAVFPAPAMEDFRSCDVKLDESATGLNSDEAILTTASIPSTTPLTGLDSILRLFPWSAKNRIGITTYPSSSDNVVGSTTPSFADFDMSTPTEHPFPSSNPTLASSLLSPKSTENCKIAEIIIHHFPGPCTTDITCEGGAKLTIDKCQSSLNFVSI